MTQTFTIHEPKAPATEKQISFLTSLIKNRECPAVAERYTFAQGFLTKGAASKLIDEALKAPKKTGNVSTVQDWGQAKTVQAAANQVENPTLADQMAATLAEAKPVLTELPGMGYYQLDGVLYYYDVTGKDWSPTLRRLVITTTYDGKKKGSWKKVAPTYGSPKVTGTWLPYGGKHFAYKTEITKTIYVPKSFAEAVLAGAKPLTKDEAGALGKKFGICIRCGALLSDPVSVAQGLGPVCITYWS